MSYWTDRQRQLNEAAEKGEAKLKKRLLAFYETEFKRLDKEIAAYYQKYSENGVIQYRKLMESLPDAEKRILIEQTDEFVRRYPQYESLMPVRESIYKLDRLQGLQYSVQMLQANIAGYTDEQLRKYLTEISQRGVNYGMETLGFGKNFHAIDSDIVKQFVNVPWVNGENFSTRIWNDTQKLSRYLTQDIAQGFARGESYNRLIQKLRTRFEKVNRKDAYRLIYTEGTYVMAESSMQPFTEDFSQYRISTVGDSKVCPICRGISEKVFEISERQPGVNFPPFHPWCRCTFEIVVDNWDEWMEDYEKRHGNGQAEKVANRIDSDIIDSSSTKEDIQVYSVGRINRDIYKCITEDIVTDEVIITDNQMQHILDRHPEAYKEVINYLSDIIREPDFIIEDKHDNTGLVIKKIEVGKEYAQMVLRICTSDDNPNYKNSVISCWEISEKRLQNYLKNKRILYKKE